MNDLISRQAAIEALAKFVPYAICDESTESYTNGLTDAYNLICQLPSAQPEPSQVAKDIARIVENGQDMRVIAQPEIIRCKDCKYHYGENACEKDGCYGWYDTDYCSRAERRDDDSD